MNGEEQQVQRQQVEEEHLQQPWQQEVESASDPWPNTEIDSSSSSSPGSPPLSSAEPIQPLKDTGHYFPPPPPRCVQISPTGTTADGDIPLVDSLVDREPVWLEDSDAEADHDGSVCKAGEVGRNMKSNDSQCKFDVSEMFCSEMYAVFSNSAAVE